MKKMLLFVVLSFVFFACASPPTSVDPYVMVESAQRTSEAAQNQADFFGSQLTATARAPIVGYTSTAAAVSIAQTEAIGTVTFAAYTKSAQETEIASLWTPTPVPTHTPDITATVVYAMVQAEGTKMANETELNNLKIKRVQMSNTFWAVFLPILLLCLLIAAGYVGITLSRSFRKHIVQRDEKGDSPLIMDIVNGQLIDLDANPNHSTYGNKSILEHAFEQWLSRKFGYIPQLPAITSERQDLVKERDQITDFHVRQSAVLKRLPQAGSVPPQLPAPANSLPSPSYMPELPRPAVDGFIRPNWSQALDWDGRKGIPYFTAQGLKLIDVEQYPHIAVLGMTGMGKSRRWIRPLIAFALALGDRVLVIGKATDYFPFEDQPNVTLLKVSKFTQPDQAERYSRILETIVAEMNRRDDVMSASHQSTWTRAGHTRTWIVLDELGNALRMMGHEQYQAKIWVEGLVSEGRKAGFNIVLANQRATGMSSVISQTGKAIFRVEDDEVKAHKSLTGASSLAEGYYFARFGTVDLAAAWEPSDQQLKDFLASRNVKPLEPDNWIDGKIIEPKLLVEKDPDIIPVSDESIQVRIKELLVKEMTPSAIVKEIWNITGGTPWHTKKAYVEQIARSFGQNTTTTT